jgi:hypothetical protein
VVPEAASNRDCDVLLDQASEVNPPDSMIHTQNSSVTFGSIGTAHDHGLLAPHVFDQARQAVRARRGAAADETGRCDSSFTICFQ